MEGPAAAGTPACQVSSQAHSGLARTGALRRHGHSHSTTMGLAQVVAALVVRIPPMSGHRRTMYLSTLAPLAGPFTACSAAAGAGRGALAMGACPWQPKQGPAPAQRRRRVGSNRRQHSRRTLALVGETGSAAARMGALQQRGMGRPAMSHGARAAPLLQHAGRLPAASLPGTTYPVAGVCIVMVLMPGSSKPSPSTPATLTVSAAACPGSGALPSRAASPTGGVPAPRGHQPCVCCSPCMQCTQPAHRGCWAPGRRTGP